MTDRAAAGKSARQSRALWIAAAIALTHTGWALFQWYELVVARRGGEVVCGPGGGHCAEVWDSPFASAVHARTGLPVAAWGVAWGIAALVLPMVAHIRIARRRVAEPWIAATLLTAAGGALGVGVLLTASLLFGHLCTTCGLTYLLVLAYAAVCFLGLALPSPAQLARGAALVVGVLAIAFAVLFVPGQRTPQNMTAMGARAMESVKLPSDASLDEREIVSFIASLPPDAKQMLSDTLAAYAAGPLLTPPPARTVMGSANPRLQITEFSDTLCPHCAKTHELLVDLRRRFGPDAFSLAPHQYPLDPACNSEIHGGHGDPVRCLAARLQICAEGMPGEFEFVGSLFQNQTSLTEEKVWELAKSMGARADLEACVSSPLTEEKLKDDVAWAAAHGITGTPFLVINGRQAFAFAPLIYVLALSRGAPSNPAYAGLPAPQPLPWAK
jgi:serine/threonine-protein kinase